MTPFATLSPEEVLQKLSVSANGLTEEEVRTRQKKYGLNTIERQHTTAFSLFLRQITGNPLTIILAIATIISYSLGQKQSSYYIFGIILVSILLGFWNEFVAQRTVLALLKKITRNVPVFRNGRNEEIPATHITVGDIVLLSEGMIVPADMRLLEVKELEVNEATLTGESKTVYKEVTPDPQKPRQTIAFMGTSVSSGWGKGVVVAVAKDTEYGKIAKEVAFIKPVTEFQKGLMKFGQLIIKVILILTVGIFIVNALLGHSIIDSLLFSLAIAVGLTPELLPVIVTICLAHGAGKLSRKHVVAKQLIAIENLGNMDILCTDKTGTLTEGQIHLTDYFDSSGHESQELLSKALITLPQVKTANAIDCAILASNHAGLVKKYEGEVIEQEPFNYEKRASYAVIDRSGKRELIVRGSPEAITAASHKNETLHKKFIDLEKDGLRVVVIASKSIEKKKEYGWEDLHGLQIDGYLTFLDAPKKTAKEALQLLTSLDVQLKILTGDSDLVTKKICEEVGLETGTMITGPELVNLSEAKLDEVIEKTTVFARLAPDQKLQIVQLLQKKGHAVGYLGDGVNDLPTLHAADVGISVNTAVDVAKDAAAIVLLHKSLNVIADGIVEGRKTFHNTIKYILMATSSNFGNMFSAAGASFFLSFLPMTPVQILLTNGLYDLSQTAIPTDNVDVETLKKPKHWDIGFLRNYMIFFGPISSVFDYATFFVMLFLFHASPSLFQTGWFVESIATQILVIFVIRTSRTPFFLSKPSIWLFGAAMAMVGVGVYLPFSPLAHSLGFVPLPPLYFLVVLFLIVTYLLLVEIMKSIFLRRYSL